MGAQTVSTSSIHLQTNPCHNLTHPNSTRKIHIPFYHTKTSAEEDVESYYNQMRVWQEDIRKFIAAQVRVLKARIKQLGHNDIEARFLLFPFPSLRIVTLFPFSRLASYQRPADRSSIAGHPLGRKSRIVAFKGLRGFVGGDQRR